MEWSLFGAVGTRGERGSVAAPSPLNIRIGVCQGPLSPSKQRQASQPRRGQSASQPDGCPSSLPRAHQPALPLKAVPGACRLFLPHQQSNHHVSSSSSIPPPRTHGHARRFLIPVPSSHLTSSRPRPRPPSRSVCEAPGLCVAPHSTSIAWLALSASSRLLALRQLFRTCSACSPSTRAGCASPNFLPSCLPRRVAATSPSDPRS